MSTTFRKTVRRTLAGALFLALTSAVSGEPAALLIGVNYRNAPDPGIPPLPGIDVDVKLMRQVAAELGITRVRELWNEQATLAGIERAIGRLSAEVGPNDLVLVYYSGHGAQVPDQGVQDEPDKMDEVWVPFDARKAGGTLQNALIDERVGELLRGIPSERVLLVVDACNSGTSAKNFEPALTAKYYAYGARVPAGAEVVEGSRSFKPLSGDETPNFIGIMAAQDHEFANATAMGSVLTKALHESVSSWEGKELTVRDLFLDTKRRVDEEIAVLRARDARISQNPRLFAENASLRGLRLSLARSEPRPVPEDDPLIREWHDLAARAPGRIEFGAGRQTYVESPPGVSGRDLCFADERHLLSLEVVAPADGYLQIVNAGQGDEGPIVLFPNRYEPNNYVKKGQRIVLPPRFRRTDDRVWCLPASLDSGVKQQAVLIAALFSEDEVNFYTDADVSAAFAPGPKEAVRSFRVEGDGGSAGTPRLTAAGTAMLFIESR